MRTVIRGIALLLAATGAAVGQKGSTPPGGMFARSATPIWAEQSGLVIPSPDGKNSIVVRGARNPDYDETHAVTVRVNGHGWPTQIGVWLNAEVAWSPDSQAFFVSYSEEGSIGTYHLKVVYAGDSGLRVLEPVPNGRKLFAPKCFEHEPPNVAGIWWTGNDSSRLLIAVQVPPHSTCASMGTFQAFEISLPGGHVIARYGQMKTKKLFGSYLGDELANADDACIRLPDTCLPHGIKGRKAAGAVSPR